LPLPCPCWRRQLALDEHPHLVLDGDLFSHAPSFERSVQVLREVQRQSRLRSLLLALLRPRLLRPLPGLHPLLRAPWQLFLGSPRPHDELHFLFLARHVASFSTSFARD